MPNVSVKVMGDEGRLVMVRGRSTRTFYGHFRTGSIVSVDSRDVDGKLLVEAKTDNGKRRGRPKKVKTVPEETDEAASS